MADSEQETQQEAMEPTAAEEAPVSDDAPAEAPAEVQEEAPAAEAEPEPVSSEQEPEAAGDGGEQDDQPATDESPAADGEAAAEGEEQVAEQPAEGEAPPTEGETQAEGEDTDGAPEQQDADDAQTEQQQGDDVGAPEEQQQEGEEGEKEGEQIEGEAAEGEEKPEGEEGEKAVEGEASAEGEAPAEGDAPAEGEVPPEGDAPAEGEVPAEGDAPAEGEAPAEGDTPAEGEGPAEGEAAAEGEAPAEGEAAQEGEVVQDGEAPEGEQQEMKPASEGIAGDTIVEEEEPPEEPQSPVPQSDTFAEGEKPESPVAVGEKLSREGSPQPQEMEDQPPMLEPGTPERYDSDEEGEGKTVRVEDIIEEEEEDEEEPEFDRDLLIEKYHAAIAEREQYQQQNYQLQHKLADYFRKKKSDDTRQEVDKNVTDQEQRYLKYMSNLEDLRRQDSDLREDYKRQIEDLKDKCADRKEKVDFESDQFIQFKRTVATNAINSRSGKPIAQKDIDTYLLNEMKKEAEVVGVRLENIKLKNKLKKKELQLKSKEELAEGLHLIDFEQLKIENQTYNEKIEERNEELLKLRRKITGTVQVLTHLKEKLQFVQAENSVQKAKLRDVEEFVAKKRDVLSRTKQARDALRIDNQKLRQNCGLLGNEPLLRDFEERKDEGDDLKQKLEDLKMLHAELTLNCTGVRRKIDQARAETA